MQRCATFLVSFLTALDRQLDARMVGILAQGIGVVVRHFNRALALLLNELGSYLCGPEHTPAGLNRLANLLHSPRWQATVIHKYRLDRGTAAVLAEPARGSEGRALSIMTAACWRSPRVRSWPGWPRCAPAKPAGWPVRGRSWSRATSAAPPAAPSSCQASARWPRGDRLGAPHRPPPAGAAGVALVQHATGRARGRSIRRCPADEFRG